MGQAHAAPPDKRLLEFHADEQQRTDGRDARPFLPTGGGRAAEQELQDHQYTQGDERGTVAQESGPVAQTGYSM
jgi:hypothetical protein